MLLLALLIGYGSLFPFDYVPHRPTWADPLHLLTVWPRRLSSSDVVGNVLLFVPLGWLIPGLARRTSALLAWALAAVAYAWFFQYLQFWFPSRDPSGSDATFNTLGLAIGLLLGLATRRFTTWHAARLDRDSPLWPATATLLLLWLAYRWFPWALTSDLGNFRHAIKALARDPALELPSALHDAAAWLLWFWLARRGPFPLLSTPRAMTVGAVLIVAAEPLFIGNSVSAADLLGLTLALALRPLLQRQPSGGAWLLALLATSLVVSGLSPWVFGARHHFYWLPFAGMLSGSMVVNTASLIQKCYLYGGAVLLLASLLRGFAARWWIAGLLVAAGLAWIEWMQTHLAGRVAEITDPLLALLLALCFYVAQARSVSRTSKSAVRALKQPLS